jgi:GNAT superfamily N-acetyltransferase
MAISDFVVPWEMRAREISPLVREFSHLVFREGRKVDIRLRFRTDLDALAEVNARNRASWLPLFPIFDPAYHDFPPGSVVWAEGLNRRQETVATYAARALDWSHTTLGEESRSLRVFYDDPAVQAAPGDFAEIPDIPSTAIAGRTACVGALWVRPDYRSFGLTKLLSRLCKAYACAQWDVTVCWGFVNPAHVASGVSRAFGSVRIEPGVNLRLQGYDLPAAVTYQARADLVSDIVAAVRRGEIDSSRRIVTTPTNDSDARCQGIASR